MKSVAEIIREKMSKERTKRNNFIQHNTNENVHYKTWLDTANEVSRTLSNDIIPSSESQILKTIKKLN